MRVERVMDTVDITLLCHMPCFRVFICEKRGARTPRFLLGGRGGIGKGHDRTASKLRTYGWSRSLTCEILNTKSNQSTRQQTVNDPPAALCMMIVFTREKPLELAILRTDSGASPQNRCLPQWMTTGDKIGGVRLAKTCVPVPVLRRCLDLNTGPCILEKSSVLSYLRQSDQLGLCVLDPHQGLDSGDSSNLFDACRDISYQPLSYSEKSVKTDARKAINYILHRGFRRLTC